MNHNRTCFKIFFIITFMVFNILFCSKGHSEDGFYVIPVQKKNAYDYDFSRARVIGVDDGVLLFENVIIDGQSYNFQLPKNGLIGLDNMTSPPSVQIPTKNIVIDGDHSDWWVWHPISPYGPGDGYVEYVVQPYLRETSPGTQGSDRFGDAIYTGSSTPEGDALGADIMDAFVARDNDYVYVAMNIYNETNAQTLYLFELMQFMGRGCVPGDSLILLQGNTLLLHYRGLPASGKTYDSNYYRYADDSGTTSIGFFEFKIPISDLEVACGCDEPCNPPLGIENRYIQMYSHKTNDYIDWVGFGERKMVQNFYSQ